MTFKVLFDANVLVPAQLNDILLTFASAEMYQPLWSADIIKEVENTLTNKLGIDSEKVTSRLNKMEEAFPEANIYGYNSLIAGIDCTDIKDRHVLAAAITGGAGALITFNLKDFPTDLFQVHGIDLEHPDEFLAGQFDLDSAICSERLAILLHRWNSPSKTIDELIFDYKDSLPEFVKEIEKNRGAIEFHISLTH